MQRHVLLLLASLGLPAVPVLSAAACEPAPEEILRAVNRVRAQPQACGERLWPAVAALRPNPLLAESARRYAVELAARDRIDHTSAAGTSLRTRLRESGYLMRSAGENLAGGPETLDEAMAQWLGSPSHCENLMAAEFQEFGMACVTGPGKLQRYWVLHLAVPAKAAR